MHSRLLLQKGDVEFAVTEYRQAVREDDSLRDEALAAELGIDADESSEVVDGFLVLLAGALLLTPGFLTDAVGVVLLVPPARAGIRRSAGTDE